MRNSTPKTWLITGCSTGLGNALVRLLIDQGENVIATARNPESIASLVAGNKNARAVKLDVTQSDQIASAVGAAEQEFGHIDYLVNNAGYGFISAIEEASEKEYRDLFEANFFGLVAMTKAVLPGMRKRKTGHIINVSSVGGMRGNAGSGYYAASKFAVIGFTEALAKEAAHLGIKATVIAPAGLRTDWAGRSLQYAANPISDYKDTVHARISSYAKTTGTQPGDPIRGAQAIIAIANSDAPPLHLILSSNGVKMARENWSELISETDKWEALSASVDYPREN